MDGEPDYNYGVPSPSVKAKQLAWQQHYQRKGCSEWNAVVTGEPTCGEHKPKEKQND